MPNPLQFVVLAFLFALIGGLVANAIPTLMRRQTPDVAEIIDQKFKVYEDFIKKYSDIEAILSLLTQLKRDPRLIEQLRTFPDYLVSGVLLHRVQQLAAQHQALMDKLTVTHRYYNTYGGDRTQHVAHVEDDVEHVWKQLETARTQAIEFGVGFDSQTI